MRRLIIAVVIVCLLVVGGAMIYKHKPKPVGITLKLMGTPGLKIGGTYTIDNQIHSFTGAVPTNITIMATQFEYDIRMLEARGELRGDLNVSTGSGGGSATKDNFAGVKGAVIRRWGRHGVWMTTTRPGE